MDVSSLRPGGISVGFDKYLADIGKIRWKVFKAFSKFNALGGYSCLDKLFV